MLVGCYKLALFLLRDKWWKFHTIIQAWQISTIPLSIMICLSSLVSLAWRSYTHGSSFPSAWWPGSCARKWHPDLCGGSGVTCRVLASCGAWTSHCGAWAPGVWALGLQQLCVAHRLSSCDLQALKSWPSSCGARAWLPCGMWNLPRPGIEPMSPALAGRFLTSGPPGTTIVLLHLLSFF